MKKFTYLPGMFLLMASAWMPANAQIGSSAQSLALKSDQITEGQKIVFRGISVTNTEWVNWAGPSTDHLSADNVFIVENSGSGIVLKRESDNQYIGRSSSQIAFVGDKSNATVFTVSAPALDGTNVTGTHEVALPSWVESEDNYQIRFSTSDNNFLNVQEAKTSSPQYANGKDSWSVSMAYNANEPLSSIQIKFVDEMGNLFKTDFDVTTTGSTYSLSAPEISGYQFSGIVFINDQRASEVSTTINENTTIAYYYESLPPFAYSTLSEDGSSFEDVTWYRIGIHAMEANRRYWTYNAEQQKLELASTSKPFDMFSDEQLFCFVGTNKANIKIYNKAAGTSVWATYDGENNQVSMTNNPDVTYHTWSLAPSTTVNGNYCFKTNVEGVTDCYINNYNMVALKYYAFGDNGSTCYFTEFDFDTAVEDYKNTLDQKLASVEDLVGYVGAPATLSDWQTPIDAFKADPTFENYQAVQTALTLVVTVEPNQFYRLINADYATRETPAYISITADKDGKLQAARAEQIDDFANMPQTMIRFITNENGKYALNLQGENIGNTQNQNQPVYLENRTNGEASYQTGDYELANKATACYVLKCTNAVSTGDGGNKVCLTVLAEANESTGYKISTWGDGVKYSQWYLQPVKTVRVAISDAGYATVNYPFAVQVPEGMSAYTGTANAEEGVFTLDAIENGIIPANTPVLLEGNAGTYTLEVLADDTTPAVEGNGLSGTLLSRDIVTATNAYILGNGNSGVGFYQMSADDRTLGSNKAYLELPATMSGIRSITIGGQTTGIKDTVSEGVEAEEYYDLQGRRVMNPTKGIYVTKSAKKVIFNN